MPTITKRPIERTCTAHNEPGYEAETRTVFGMTYILLRCPTCHRPNGERLLRRSDPRHPFNSLRVQGGPNAERLIMETAIPFAEAWDSYAEARPALMTKTGRPNDSKVYQALLEAGMSLPSESEVNRALRVGRNVAPGTEWETWERFCSTGLTRDKKTLARWCAKGQS